jgi:hypothetical protein
MDERPSLGWTCKCIQPGLAPASDLRRFSCRFGSGLPLGEVVALACVDRDRELVAIVLVREVIDHLRDERHRDVVDAVELDVLQRAQCGALARPRQPGDDHDLHYSTASSVWSVIARCS